MAHKKDGPQTGANKIGESPGSNFDHKVDSPAIPTGQKNVAISDGSDAQGLPLLQADAQVKVEGTEDRPENIHPLVEEFGELFFVGKKAVQANQVAVAAQFAESYQIRFDHKSASFVRYNSATGLWESQKDSDVKVGLAKFVKQQAEKNQALEFIPKRTNSFLGAVMQLLKGFAFAEDKEPQSHIVHVGNGILDASGEKPVLRQFDPSFLSRRMCSISYKPEKKCPRFTNELLKPCLHEDDIDLLQRYFGAVLLGNNAAQRFLVVYGTAARGKSTTVTLGERVIGLENVAHLRTEHLSGRFESHAFLNKTLLTAKDVPGDFLARRGAQMLKALVGDDLIESEMKYGGKFRMRGNFNIIVTSNNRLRVGMEEDEPAWRRRLIVIRFGGDAPPKRIANFGDALLCEEKEGILAWMVEGAVKHIAELETGGDFSLTKDQTSRVDDLLQESKSPSVFVTTQVSRKIKAEVSVEELQEGYLAFCKAKGWEAVSVRQFSTYLADLMQRHHGVLRRNDIRRGGKAVRGFKHVVLSTGLRTSN